jgi:hypothetical protein
MIPRTQSAKSTIDVSIVSVVMIHEYGRDHVFGLPNWSNVKSWKLSSSG